MTHTKFYRSLLMAGAGTLALMVGACSGSFLNTGGAKKAPAKEVRSAASLMRLGDSAWASGSTAAAARFYDAASKAAPKDPVPKMRLARTLQAMGAHAAAIVTYRAALALKPDITDAERGIANSLISLDKPHEAVKLYRAVIAKTGDYRAYNGLGVALDMVGKQKAARDAYRAGLEKRPDNLSLKNNLALSMALAGEYAAAAEMLREVAKNPRATARHRQNLALVYGLSGEYKRAAKVARIDLDTPAISGNLAYYEWLRKQPRSTVKKLLGRGGSAKPAATRKKSAAKPVRQPVSRVYRPISSLGIARSEPRIVQAVERREDGRLPVRFARLEVGRGSEVQSVMVSNVRPVARPVVAQPVVAPPVAQPVVAPPVVAQPVVAPPVAQPVVAPPVVAPPVVAPPVPRIVVGKPRVKAGSPRMRQVASVKRTVVASVERTVVASVERRAVTKRRMAKIQPNVVFARLGLDYIMGKAK